ncbi:MAG: hypothetical protein FJ135_09845 [Deltaproteobacteria bacterium]|nr:hypothetical protein [Deltaproteobacteria bacterium]
MALGSISSLAGISSGLRDRGSLWAQEPHKVIIGLLGFIPLMALTTQFGSVGVSHSWGTFVIFSQPQQTCFLIFRERETAVNGKNAGLLKNIEKQ